MKIARHVKARPAKGWCLELAHPSLPVMGYANAGIDEPHYHRELREVYLVARGSSLMKVAGEELRLIAGDVIVVEPGEVHTFVDSSPDYFHFVLHCPPLKGDKVLVDKIM